MDINKNTKQNQPVTSFGGMATSNFPRPDKKMDVEQQTKIIEDESEVKIVKMNWLQRFWHKTIFPDMIQRKRERKELERQQAEMLRQVQHEAKMEAFKDSKNELKEHYKKQEIEKLKSGDANNSKFVKILKKVGEDIAGSGFKIPDNNRMRDVWGANKQGDSGNSGQGQSPMGGGMFDQNKLTSMMGGNRNTQVPQNQQQNTQRTQQQNIQQNNSQFEQDRIKNLIGGTSRTNFNMAPPQQPRKKRAIKKKKATKRRTRKK